MTKIKALIYLIIFIVLIFAAQDFKKKLLYNPSEKFNAMCKNVMEPSCQVYLNKITKEKKYKEAIEIQNERLRQNKQVLNIFKFKIANKFLLIKTSKEADKMLLACMEKQNCKKDYFLLKVSDDTLRDIVLDSLITAEIQYNELKDPKSAIETLKHAQYIVKTNRYFYARQETLKEIDKQIAQIKKSNRG